MISDLLVDLFRVSVVFCRLLVLGFEKFQYTNAKRLVYFHKRFSSEKKFQPRANSS